MVYPVIDDENDEQEDSTTVLVYGSRPNWLDQWQDLFITFGDSLSYALRPSDAETGTLPDSIRPRISSRIERFVYFNETESALVVNGTLMAENDAGTWEIPVEVSYYEPYYQVFRSQVVLHVRMSNDQVIEDEKPSEFDASER